MKKFNFIPAKASRLEGFQNQGQKNRRYPHNTFQSNKDGLQASWDVHNPTVNCKAQEGLKITLTDVSTFKTWELSNQIHFGACAHDGGYPPLPSH